MSVARIFFILLCAGLFAGCTVHPLPENVSRKNTFEIVRNLRCEAKFAVADKVQYLLQSARSNKIREMPPQLTLRNIEYIRRHEPDIANKIDKYKSSAIGYDFQFDITESNEKAASAGFRLPFTTGLNGTFNWGVGTSLSKVRQARREFATSETFGQLVKLNCDGLQENNKRLIYPLTGSVGMTEIIDTFLNLGELGGGQDVFKDTLTFTTTVEAGANASVAIDPVTNKHKIINAATNSDNSRVDIHQVTISLAFPLIDDRTIQRLGGLKGKLKDQVERETLEFVRVQRCIQRAEAREDRAGVLRQTAPEIFCQPRRFDGLTTSSVKKK